MENSLPDRKIIKENSVYRLGGGGTGSGRSFVALLTGTASLPADPIMEAHPSPGHQNISSTSIFPPSLLDVLTGCSFNVNVQQVTDHAFTATP